MHVQNNLILKSTDKNFKIITTALFLNTDDMDNMNEIMGQSMDI